jgi:murein DD-endopeptidase MepM/ murein hydrolase activator NlpD
MTTLNRKPAKKNGRIIILVLLFAALAAAAWYVLRDTTPPALTIAPEQGYLNADSVITITAMDEGVGLKRLSVRVLQDGKDRFSVDKSFPSAQRSHQESIQLKGQPLADGPIEVAARADDHGFFLFSGSKESRVTLILDTKSPRINMISTQHNISQGGSALVAFEVNEDLRECGVEVGDWFFPAYRQENGTYLCLLGMPWDVAPAQFSPVIRAVDLAGNKSTRALPQHANAKHFRQDRLNLPESFLVSKGELFKRVFPNDPETDPLGRYIKINNELRKQNRDQLREIGLETAPAPLWNGSFLRAAGATTANFGDNRDYYYNGVAVDNQTHLGVDIANHQNSPIEAANDGKVVFAEFLGIYGECVIIDHGLGLQSIYAHLSRIDVNVGDMINKGQQVGLSGTTGLAGGDHLHFGMLVSGLPVQPREWWDAGWIAHNITPKLESQSTQ